MSNIHIHLLTLLLLTACSQHEHDMPSSKTEQTLEPSASADPTATTKQNTLMHNQRHKEEPRNTQYRPTPPFSRPSFDYLLNIVRYRPITEDTPLTKEEVERDFGRYCCSMPSYEEWSPSFDTNQDGKIDLEEFLRAKALNDFYYCPLR